MSGSWQKIKDNYRKFGQQGPANFFLVLALCFGIVMACVNPPFQECDGWMHYLWATDVSYGNVASPVLSLSHQEGIALVPKNINEFGYHIIKPDTGEGGEYIQYLKSVKASSKCIEMKLADVPSSLFYYPQALGLFLSRVFSMSVYGGVVLSRICNLLVFLFLAYLALRITPVFKNIMAVIGLFPITIYQAASEDRKSVV